MFFYEKFASGAIAGIIQRLQDLDPEYWQSMAPHWDKMVCLELLPCAPLYFKITPTGLTPSLCAPDSLESTTFSGTLAAFLRALSAHNFVQSDLSIRGDIACAQALYQCWQHRDLDWEGPLATMLGDPVAQAVSIGAKKFYHWASATYQARREDLGVYLQDEINVLPSSPQVEQFFKEVDVLRDDVARLEARLETLELNKL